MLMRRSARKKVKGVKKFNKLYRSEFKFPHYLRECLLKNIMFSFGHCPNYLVSDFHIEWVFQKISFKNTRVYVAYSRWTLVHVGPK